MNMSVSAVFTGAAVFFLTIFGGTAAHAHFGMVIPELPILTDENRSTDISLSFSHPFEGLGMKLEKPKRFFMIQDGEQTDLADQLEPAEIMASAGYRYGFSPKRPGVYHFVMEPQPYWEPIEDRFIIHYTKTVVAAFGAEENWMQPLGLPAEIRPLLRPFGNYRGNSFTGQVLIDGKAAGGAEVEVEYYNRDNSFQAPTDYHITQVITADDNGIFTFTCPLSGWWGFASLSLADYTLENPAGQEKEVEIGGVLWIYLDEFRKP